MAHLLNYIKNFVGPTQEVLLPLRLPIRNIKTPLAKITLEKLSTTVDKFVDKEKNTPSQ